MKTVKYVPKELSAPFLSLLHGKFSKLSAQTQKEISSQVPAGKMYLFVSYDDAGKVSGGIVVRNRDTKHGNTAFVYGIFGTDIVDRDYFGKLVRLLKMIGFEHIQGFGKETVLRLYKSRGIPLEKEGENSRGIFFGAKL